MESVKNLCRGPYGDEWKLYGKDKDFMGQVQAVWEASGFVGMP